MNQSGNSKAGLFPAEAELPGEHKLEAIEQREYLRAGKIWLWEGRRQDVLSPVMTRGGESLRAIRLGSYPLMEETDALAALDAAEAAYDHGRGEWPTMAISGRIECMQNFALRMAGKREEVARLIMWEVGKTWTDSLKEFDRTLVYIRDSIDALKSLDRASSRFEMAEDIIAQIRRAPLGICLCMGPFNYPLNETFTLLIPALLMGNCAIFKPPKLGVLLHRPLLEAFRDSFPPGTVNTVYGEGEKVAAPLMATGRVDVLAFIGTSRVAGILKKLHPKPYRLRSVLGLEAKNPAIILADADIDVAVKECLLGALSFNGQRCTALKVIFAHSSVSDRFAAELSKRVADLACGMPWQQGISITPLPEPGKPEYLAGLVTDAIEKGAKIANPGGGERAGSFFYPAVLYPAKAGMRVYSEEQFGPVVPIVPFDRIEEPIEYLTSSSHGQQCSLFGRDPRALSELIDPLVNQVCRVNINSQCQRGPDTFPFTGRKDSAEGTLSVSDALRVFSIRTLVAAKATPDNKGILKDIVQERLSDFLSTDFIF